MSEVNQITETDAEEYLKRVNVILDRMKKAIQNNKGIRLSSEEMQLISTTEIGQIIMAEAVPYHESFRGS